MPHPLCDWVKAACRCTQYFSSVAPPVSRCEVSVQRSWASTQIKRTKGSDGLYRPIRLLGQARVAVVTAT
jgi:hypothetical protein